MKFTTAGAAGTAPGITLFGGGGANASQTKSIRPDILVDASATGSGSSFLTIDTVTGLVRPLAAAELASTLTTATSTNTNVSLTTVASSTATLTRQQPDPAERRRGFRSGSRRQPVGRQRLAPEPEPPGLRRLARPRRQRRHHRRPIQSSANVTLDIHVVGAATLALNAPINSQNGFVKADAGTLLLNQPYYTNGGGANTITINGGTIKLWRTRE